VDCRVEKGGTPYGGARERGLGVQLDWGSLGHTYGDSRPRKRATITLWLWWPIRVHLSWWGKS
jgi:hypothetical protein